jgi:hypothetical protein
MTVVFGMGSIAVFIERELLDWLHGKNLSPYPQPKPKGRRNCVA